MIVRFLRAPLSARPWRELAYVVVGLVPAVPAFVLAILGLVFSVLSVLLVGLPMMAGVLACARPVNRGFRWPARRFLGWDWPSPPPIKGHRMTTRALALLRDDARWRTLVYCFVKLPLDLLTAYVGVVAVVISAVFLTYPAWYFVAPSGLGFVEDAGWGRTWLVALEALALVLVWPWLLRLLVALDRLLVRALLEPRADQQRITDLQVSRAALTADAATVLRKIERDLHDGTQARLVALGVALGRIGHRVDDAQVRSMIAEAQGGVTEALDELRDIVRGIHPPALDDGLPTAVATLAARSAVPVHATVELMTRPPDATASALYFSIAELLTNVTRHADATRVWLALAENDEGFRLQVSDDGRGGASVDGAGTGLVGLVRRARALDGTVEINSPSGGPTTVIMRLPYDRIAPPYEG